jgi:DNA-binding transcriptional LysR family regulator
MRFDLVDLKLFRNVYEAGSITGGAASSNLTLQSASERIWGMEDELGVPLLNRSKSGVKLTEAGYSLIHHANIVLHQVEHMRSELHQYGKGLKGHIRLLCNSSAQSEYLPELLGSFLMEKPNISISVKEMLSNEIITSIKKQTADLGIVADSTHLHGLESIPFRDDELVVLVPAMSEWYDRESVTFEDILDTEFVGLMEGAALQDHIDDFAKKRGKRLSYRVRVSSFEAIFQIVHHGVGIGIVPKRLSSQNHGRQENLLFVHVPSINYLVM